VKHEAVEVVVDGRELTLSNLAKPMYPNGFTKAQVIDYYQKVAPALLPHIRGRPLTRIRYPHGVGDKFFFEKNAPSHRPEWVKTARVKHKGDAIEFIVCDDRATLVWLANLAALELHPQLHLAAHPETPTLLVFDLDPGLPAALLECCDVALWVRDLLADLGLKCFPKVSGGKGMQVYAPLNTPGVTYEQTKSLSRGIAEALERSMPDRVVSKMAKVLRTGKVFVDWSQNDQVKTTVAVYSLRAQPTPKAGAPLAWKEVEATRDAGEASGLVFEADAVLARVVKLGDLFEPVAKLKQKLPSVAAG
jgi:bifunctional non-homologous end joining protein LigD